LLIAQNKMQELILADQSLNKNEKYYCPSCQNPVHLKLGSIIRPHFAHFQNDACEVFAEGETFEHIEGKMQLAEWLENLGMQVEIEAYYPSCSNGQIC
jgi:Competence protein